MNRSLKLSMLLALALGSTQAAALELGQIQVKSALGQPLLADIPLTPDSPAELRNLTARLASPEDFARAGLGGARPDIPLQFSIVDVGGRKVIRITTATAVNDPYLDLLVEVDSAAGRSLREFPVLLDPPGTAPVGPGTSAPRSSAPRAAARPGTAAPAPARTTAAPASAPAQSAAGHAPASGRYGPVERGQTLSGIARRVAPAGVDPDQMMLALKQANPDAFFQDNINALKSGAVLRVPTRQEAQAMSVAAAMAEVRRQNGDWRAEAARSTTTVADAATRAETSSAPSGAPATDRLALVPAKEGGKGAGVQGGSGKGNAALRQDLLRSQETLTTLQQQSVELKSRLKDLQDINDKNTRLLALKDNEIAELQQKLAQARKHAGTPAAASTAAKGHPTTMAAANAPAMPAAGGSAPAKPGSALAAPGVATASSVHPATVAPIAAGPNAKSSARPGHKPAKPMAKVASPWGGEDAWYMQPWVWEAAGGALLLLIVLALLGRRRKPAASAKSTPAVSSLADRFGPLPEPAAASADPEQDELLDQLAEHPDDIGLHLELVSLYYSRRDVEHFEAAAEAMHAHVVDPQQDEWQDVVAMGEDLAPGHPLFAQAADHAAPDTTGDADVHADEEALHPFDLDSYAAHAETTEPEAARSKVSEYHFDFDLTPPPVQQTPFVSSEPEEPSSVDDSQAVTGDEYEEADPASLAALETETDQLDPSHEPLSWNFDPPVNDATDAPTAESPESAQFSDDPIDTKLDLARAYMDMGDADGARAMLEEVMNEGSQVQQDAAQRLLDSMA